MMRLSHGIGLLVNVAFLLTNLWALIDASARPPGAYAAIGHKKSYWVGGLAAGMVLGLVAAGLPLVGIVAIVASIVYLVEYRPKLREIGRAGSGGW